jgi:hypothetical protein
MLSPEQIKYADAAYSIYDHDWRFYSEFIGEPFLCGDCLAYFDGTVLSFCAFPLGDCARKVEGGDLLKTVENFPYAQNLRGLEVWGRYDPLPPNITCGGASLNLVESYAESTMTDVKLDVRSFSFETNAKARLNRNWARNKGVVTTVGKLERLSHEHIALMEQFFLTHKISTLHTTFYLAIPSLIKNDNVFVVEGRVEGKLKGYAVLSQPNPEVACMIIGFYDNAGGFRATDGIYAQTIEWAQAQNLHYLHFGYSATESLLAFKRKWGATIDGPPYYETRYAVDSRIADAFKNGKCTWRERVYQSAISAGPA